MTVLLHIIVLFHILDNKKNGKIKLMNYRNEMSGKRRKYNIYNFRLRFFFNFVRC